MSLSTCPNGFRLGRPVAEVPGTTSNPVRLTHDLEPVRLEHVPEVDPADLEPVNADQRGRVPLPLAGFVMPPCMAGFHHPCI